jgi:hypothetical protein
VGATCLWASYEAPSTKDIILKYIDNVPGIRYRELLRLGDLTNGTLEYTVRSIELDMYEATLQNPPCRVNECKLLTKGFNY